MTLTASGNSPIAIAARDAKLIRKNSFRKFRVNIVRATDNRTG